MSEQVDRVLEAQEEVNINFKVPRAKREAFKGWCAEQKVTVGKNGKKKVTASGMLISFMDDCLMMGKVFETKKENSK